MSEKLIINADGGSRGNPGSAAIGIIIRNERNEILIKHKEIIGKQTNNFAEYSSLIKALKLAKELTSGEIEIIMDSELVVRQLNGKYKVKSPNLKALNEEATSLLKNFSKVIFSNVPREDKFQSLADKLVNDALDQNS